MLAQKLMSAMAGGSETLYVDDVFSAYTYTGNGSTQTINNGIDLAGKGGLVWIKSRSNGSYQNTLTDTVKGTASRLFSDSTAAENTSPDVSAFTSSGFSVSSQSYVNASSATYVSWTFRKAPKFFDVVTYTGNGNTNLIPHNLGVMPGMVVIKQINGTSNWGVWHRRDGVTPLMRGSLNSSSAFGAGSTFGAMSDTILDVNVVADHTSVGFNTNGASYVAYLFAHDTTADGIIQCGSYTGNASTQAVTLGWEPQFLLIKKADGIADWAMFDCSRGLSFSSDAYLNPNTSNAESLLSGLIYPTATGFYLNTAIGALNDSGAYIYLAIRRPNKPPTTGTQVYNAIARTGTNSATTISGVGFAPDYVQARVRDGSPGDGGSFATFSRLIGPGSYLNTALTSAAISDAGGVTAFTMDGVTVGGSGSINNGGSPNQYINHFFKRAPGFFDVVCYTGTMSTATVNHNLGVAPELLIVRNRTAGVSRWCVYAATEGATKWLALNQNLSATTSSVYWNNTAPTSTVFTVTGDADVGSTSPYVAYLFASLPGVSKVGTYTGNGSSQTINCGFSAGARFILIKRTDAAGDWYVWDTARGIVSANDPHLSLNTTAAEVTSNDSVDPDSTGFIVNQNTTTNINVTSATYIYLAIS